jgi:hypothetical protein
MTNASINDIKVPTFSTRSQRDVETITVAFMGNADMAVHEQLKVFFDELHLWAEACRVREAIFDLEELYFMNSSCLSLLLRLINSIKESRRARPYKLRFRSNPNLRWQKRSLEAIRSFAADVVAVE